MDKEIDEILKRRDSLLGLGGNFNVIIQLKLHGRLCALRVDNLTKSAARILFDQIDESNSVTDEFIIQITNESGKVIDYNKLPNAFTGTY